MVNGQLKLATEKRGLKKLHEEHKDRKIRTTKRKD
jgi:hypothetical protein